MNVDDVLLVFLSESIPNKLINEQYISESDTYFFLGCMNNEERCRLFYEFLEREITISMLIKNDLFFMKLFSGFDHYCLHNLMNDEFIFKFEYEIIKKMYIMFDKINPNHTKITSLLGQDRKIKLFLMTWWNDIKIHNMIKTILQFNYHTVKNDLDQCLIENVLDIMKKRRFRPVQKRGRDDNRDDDINYQKIVRDDDNFVKEFKKLQI